MEKIHIGDWVMGRSKEGHQVVGYVTGTNSSGTAVYTVDACCDKLIGKNVHARTEQLATLPESKYTDTEGYIRNMIDFSLITRDEELFRDMANALRKLKDPDYFQHLTINLTFGASSSEV